MIKGTLFALVTGALVCAALPSAAMEAPKGGFKRCLEAGNSAQVCEQRRRDIESGLLKPDCNYGRGSFRAPGKGKKC